MPAPKGNQFWKARTKHGRDKLISDPVILWESCCEYFQWIEDNPLEADKVNFYQGEAFHEPEYRIRAMTKQGLCFFLGIDINTWNRWKEGDDEDFCRVLHEAEDVIYNQKFAGAAADLLNANIIARDLGLIDKSESNVRTVVKRINLSGDEAHNGKE